MDKRTLGGTLEVSTLGLGCMGMSMAFGARPPREEMTRFLRSAVDRGVTLFDTAEVYGPFHNEELLGEALQPVRDDIVLATKFGFAFDESGNQTGVSSRPMTSGPRSRAHSGGCVQTASTCSTSTASTPTYRSRTSRAPSRSSSTPARCATSACPRPVSAPSAAPTPCSPSRHCRASTPSSGANQRTRSSPPSRAGHRLRAVQSLGTWPPHRAGDRRSQFSEGDIRATLPRFEREALQANLALVDLVSRVAEHKGATVGQVALAWLLSQKPWIVPIPGTRRLERLEENLGSADLELTREDLAELTRPPRVCRCRASATRRPCNA